MNRKSKLIDGFVIGFAAFAMFFGAGNLIFPASIGLYAGEHAFSSFWGFFLTGILLPVLGILSVLIIGGSSVRDLANKVSHGYSFFIGLFIVLLLGPFMFMPRTGSTAFELSLMSYLPDTVKSSGVQFFCIKTAFCIIYFSIALFFSIKQSKVIDYIGKLLTPSLIILLAIIIINGLITPISPIQEPGKERAFLFGFTSGYQTGDVLASVFFAIIIISAIKNKGYKGKAERMKALLFACIVAGAGLVFVYGGLMYIGSHANFEGAKDLGRTEFINKIVNLILGQKGSIIFSISVLLACLTTTVGLASATGQYISEVSKDKFSYKKVVLYSIFISMILANFNVDNIIAYSDPVLRILYPQIIFLIITSVIFGAREHHKLPYQLAAATIFVFTIPAFVGSLPNNPLPKANTFLSHLMSEMPLEKHGFTWVVFGLSAYLVGFAISHFLVKKTI